MEMSGLLLKQIAALFIIMGFGFALVRLKILKSQDSRSLSMILIYLVNPCVILKAFQIDFTPEVRDRFLLAMGVAVAINLVLMLITWIYGKVLKLDAVERTSIMYANSGNLVIPLVTAMLGEEWVIYASAFMSVQMIFMWTHGQAQIGGAGGISWKKILLNINIVAIAVGLVLLVSGIRLPEIVNNALGQLSAAMGPMNMIMLGMLLTDVKWGEVLRQPRNYLIMALKMIITPGIILLLLKISGVTGWVEDGRTLVYISFMAVITPCAVTVTQLAQIHRNRPAYAGALNALTTLISVVTMPLMTGLYYLLI